MLEDISTARLLAIFAGLMLGISLLAIAVDWIGKPIRRRFVPRIYRYPEEVAAIRARQAGDPTRTAWSDDMFGPPEPPPPDMPYVFSDGRSEWSDAYFEVPADAPPEPPPPARPKMHLVPEVDDDDDAEPESPPEPRPPAEPRRATSAAALAQVRQPKWHPGEYVFTPTASGNAPSDQIVRQRFWKNAAMLGGSIALGASNVGRMATGEPPRRLNRRSGVVEQLELDLTEEAWATGRVPTPRWPEPAVDPFRDVG